MSVYNSGNYREQVAPGQEDNWIINDKLTIGSGATIIGGPVTKVTTVDASGGGTAQTTNLTEIPADSILLNVQAVVVTPFDGDTTTTLEVGISGNIDKYIDTVDFDPSAAANTNAGSLSGTTNDQKTAEYLAAATQLIATWTNTANQTAGSVKVYVTYIQLS